MREILYTRSHSFSRTSRQLHVITSFDWIRAAFIWVSRSDWFWTVGKKTSRYFFIQSNPNRKPKPISTTLAHVLPRFTTQLHVKGVSFWGNCSAASVGVLQGNLVSSTGLIMRIGHRKEIRDSLRRRASARNVSFRISLRWPIHIINPVDKNKLSVACSYFELVFARCIALPYCLGSLWFWF